MSDEVRTTCPYCGVGCGVVAALVDGAPRDRAAIPQHPANRGALCSKGSALGETVGLEGRLLRPRVLGADTSLGRRARCGGAGLSTRSSMQHGPDVGRPLRLGPAAHRGLLRRQQADEGLHRLGQYRHQFAPVHVLRGRRAQAGVRRGSGAGLATRIWSWPIWSCWWGRTSPGAIRCSTSASSRPRSAGRRMRLVVIDPRRTPDLRLRRSAFAAARRHRRHAVQRLAELAGAASGARSGAFVEPPHARRSAGACWSRTTPRAMSLRWPAAAASSPRRCSRFYRLVRRHRAEWSPCSRRASTSPPPAPTRPTASSTRICSRDASAARAWGHSRSPANRMPWAAAKWAAWPTRSPRTWTWRIRDAPAHRAGFLGCAANRRAPRTQSRRYVRSHPSRRDQGHLDHRHQSGGEPARTQIARARRCGAASSSWYRIASRGPTPRRSRTCCCRRARGEKRTGP